MIRIILSMLSAVVAVVFGMQNWENVPVNLLVGPPTRIRLVFLLLMAGGVGYLWAFVRGVRREVSLRRWNRDLRKRLHIYESAHAEVMTENVDADSDAIEDDLVPRPRLINGRRPRKTRLPARAGKTVDRSATMAISDGDEDDELLAPTGRALRR